MDRSYDQYGTLDETYVASPYLASEEKMANLDEGTQYLIRLANEMNTQTIEKGIE